MERPLVALYLVLLFAVELHGGVGLYRLAVNGAGSRGRSQSDARNAQTAQVGESRFSFSRLGLLTLAAYMKIGHEHRDARRRALCAIMGRAGAAT